MKNIIKIASLLFLLLPVFSMAQDKTFLKKYAGTYNMLANGEKATPTSDKYVLTPDGKGTWIMYEVSADGTASKKQTKVLGTWSASDGIINLNFSPPGAGGDHGGELLSEFKLADGVFKAEGVFLKKVGATPKKK
jgi:hypothetical protein